MGINNVCYDELMAAMHASKISVDGCLMLELGEQVLKINEERLIAKKHFEKIGVKHTSIDINPRYF